MFKTLLYWLVKHSCLLWFRLYNRLSIEAIEQIPRQETFILAANHCSNLDPLIVGSACPRRLRFMAKEELFRIPLLGPLLRALGAVPVPRSDRQGAAAVLRLTLARLEAAESVLLFPEGTRSRDGKMKALEGGVALLAVKTGLPVIPAFVSGSYEALAGGASFPRPVKIRLRFGAPLRASELAPEGSERQRRQRLLCRLEEELLSMEASMGGADAHR